jgi:hypothetical protein
VRIQHVFLLCSKLHERNQCSPRDTKSATTPSGWYPTIKSIVGIFILNRPQELLLKEILFLNHPLELLLKFTQRVQQHYGIWFEFYIGFKWK